MAENNTDDEITVESVTGPPDFEWDEGGTDLESFENGSGLPRVVKYEDKVQRAGLPGGSLPTGLRMYAGQPVLFHARVRKGQVQARTIYRDQTGPYFEVGQTLLIPDDFEGWFEVVPPDFGRAPVCRTIGQIAEIMPRKFFTRTNIRAIRIDENEESTEDQTFKERRIGAGSVLGVVGTFAAKWQTVAQTGMFKQKSQEWTTVETTYLKCLDIDGEEIMIPTTTHGCFSIIYETGVTDSRVVYRMKDLIYDSRLPVKVRLVFGKTPVVPCIFTGMLILKTKTTEDTIIGSTILNKRNVLFELPLSAQCNVSVARNEDSFAGLKTLTDAKTLCRKFALSYGTLIKLSPELDTHQAMIQHMHTEKRKQRDDSLKNLDLLTNISADDYFLQGGSSDSDSMHSMEMAPLAMGQMVEMREIDLPRNSQAFSSV